MRCTKKLLIKLVNELLIKTEIPFECTSIDRSHFTAEQYQCGAWFWRANLKNITDENFGKFSCHILSFIPFWEIERQLNKGGILKFYNTSKQGEALYLVDLEITI